MVYRTDPGKPPLRVKEYDLPIALATLYRMGIIQCDANGVVSYTETGKWFLFFLNRDLSNISLFNLKKMTKNEQRKANA